MTATLPLVKIEVTVPKGVDVHVRIVRPTPHIETRNGITTTMGGSVK